MLRSNSCCLMPERDVGTVLLAKKDSELVIYSLLSDNPSLLQDIVRNCYPKTIFIPMEPPYFPMFEDLVEITHIAAFFRAENCLRLLDRFGYCSQHQNGHILTSAHFAAANNFVRFFECYDFSADAILLFEGEEVTVVHMACISGSIDVLNYFASIGINFSFRTKHFIHPIFAAAKYNQIDVLEFF